MSILIEETTAVDSNVMTIFHQENQRKAKAQLYRIAQEDPAAILVGLKSLSREDRNKLGYLVREADRWIGVTKKNILDFLTI